MYYRTALPTMPSESRQGFPASHPNEFVDHRQADEVISHWKAQQWQEQTFFGEDFAGRDDVSALLQVHRPQPRETIGAFYRPIPHTPKNVAQLDVHPPAMSENASSLPRQEASMMNRYAAVAAVLCILGIVASWLTHNQMERNHDMKRQDSPSKTVSTNESAALTAAVAPANLSGTTMLAKETNLTNQQ